MDIDELKVTLSMLDYDYICTSDCIVIFLHSKTVDGFLLNLLDENCYPWQYASLYDDTLAIHIQTTCIKNIEIKINFEG